MTKKKMLNILVTALLIASVMAGLFTADVGAQPYQGEIYSTDETGSTKDDFLEGDDLYFTVDINATKEVNVTVRLKDSSGTTQNGTIVKTDSSGIYISADHDFYFDLTDLMAGTYFLNITQPEGTYTNDTLTVHSNYKHGSNIYTWNDDGRTVKRTEYSLGTDLYYNASVKDTYGEPLTFETVHVGIYEKGSTSSSEWHWKGTGNDGEIGGKFVVHNYYDPGTYYLNVSYDYANFPEQVVASKRIEFYEPDFTQESEISTVDWDYTTQKDFFFGNEDLYFHVDINDQYDWPPGDNHRTVKIYAKKEGKDPKKLWTGWSDKWELDEDGELNGTYDISEFEYEELKGDYTLMVYNEGSYIVEGEIVGTEYARDTFTVISMDISIYPEQDYYTQGQEIEIRIESNFPDEINISIANNTAQPFHRLEGALWTNQDLQNNVWTAKYVLPQDLPDGTYHVVVNKSKNGNFIGSQSFNVKKFSLDLTTDKVEGVYLPGETVEVYYTVSNNLDGSSAKGVSVDWRLTYLNKTDDVKYTLGSATGGFFSFELPEMAKMNTDFNLQVWANDTSGHKDYQSIDGDVGELRTRIYLDSSSAEYLVGQTIFIDVYTEALGDDHSSSPVSNVDLEVQLQKNGDPITQYTQETRTGSNGYRQVTIELSDNISPGVYDVVVNGTWEKIWDRDEEQIEVVENSRDIAVQLETDKKGRTYYPGENLRVYYTITRQGEVVSGANVKYKIYDSKRVYKYEHITGGRIDFSIPSDYKPYSSGTLRVKVYARLDQNTYGENQIGIPIEPGKILLNADKLRYETGDNITFDYELLGISESSASVVEYKVLDSYGQIIKMGSPVNNQFNFRVPQNPTDYYRGRLTIITSSGAEINATETVSKISGYHLSLNILTESEYKTGVYEPGQELKVKYSLETKGDTVEPQSVIVTYMIDHETEQKRFETTDTNGTLEIEIPELKDGEYDIAVTVNGVANEKSFEVENDPSWMDKKSVGGMDQIGFIMLILLIIALVLGGILSILVLFRKPRSLGPSRTTEAREEEEGTYEEEPEESEEEGFVIEEGEAEPEDQWEEESQIEAEDRDW